MAGKTDRTHDRRSVLEYMVWADTGALWNRAGGVPVSRMIGPGEANAADAGFRFLQIPTATSALVNPRTPMREVADIARVDHERGLRSKLGPQSTFRFVASSLKFVAGGVLRPSTTSTRHCPTRMPRSHDFRYSVMPSL